MLRELIEREYEQYHEIMGTPLTYEKFRGYYTLQYSIIENNLLEYLLDYIEFSILKVEGRTKEIFRTDIGRKKGYSISRQEEFAKKYPHYHINTLVSNVRDCVRGYISQHGLFVSQNTKELRGDIRVLHSGENLIYPIRESICYTTQLNNVHMYAKVQEELN